MLTEIRSHARNIGTKILMLLLVLTFAVWGVEDMVTKSSSNMTVATVGSMKISAMDYKRSLFQETEKLKQSLGNQASPEFIKNLGISSYVIKQLINNRLLALESQEIGIQISDEFIANKIRKNPTFFDDKGKFSKNIFENMLRSNAMTEKSYIQQTRENIAVNLLVSTVLSPLTTPEKAGEILLAARNEQRNIELYTIPATLVNSIAAPNEEQLKDYYDTHTGQFTVPEYRTISYIEISNDDAKKSAKSTTKNSDTDKEIEAAYNDRIAEFKKPERRKVEQLLFANEEDAKKAAIAIKSGKPFEQVAKESKILNPKTIALGLVEKNNIPEEAAETVFTLASNATSEPIKTAFGWHIFHIQEIIAPTTLSLAEVRPQLEKDLEQQASENSLTDLSNKLEDAIAGGSTLSEAAKEFNLKIVTLPTIDKNGLGSDGTVEKNLPKDNKFLETAFKTEEKTESQVIAGKNGNNYIIRVDNVIQEHKKPLTEVKEKIVAGWTTEEKKKQLAAIAQKIAAGFATVATRADTIKTYSLAPSIVTVSQKKDSSQKLPAYIIKDIFSNPVGAATASFEQKNGEEYAVAVIKEIIPASRNEKDPKYISDIATISAEYNNSVQNEIIEQYLKYLATKYPVSIDEAALQIKSEE